MMKSLLLSFVTMLLLGGCALKEAPPLKTYTLDVGQVPVMHRSKYADKVLKVSFPQSLTEPLTDQMAYSYSSSDRGYYQNSQWSNNIGKLIQGDLIAALQQSDLFKAVLPAASTANEDLRLESMIYDFSHHVRGNDSYAVVSMEFILIDAHTGRLLKRKRFSYRETTPTVNAEGYVIATNRAIARLMKDVVAWLH